MPTNSNVLFRYRILDRYFSNFHRKYTIENILGEVNEKLIDVNGKGISEYLIFNAPIVTVPFYGKRCYYRYSDSFFSIFKNELTNEELTKLHSKIGIFHGIHVDAWLEETISNFGYRFGVKANSVNLVSFGQNKRLRGLEYLSEVMDSTVNHQTLEIKYKTYNGKEIVVIVHPYYVKQYNGIWFLFELYHKCMSISNMALDKVQSIKHSDAEFKKNKSYKFNTYFDDIIGITMLSDNVTKETVLFKFAHGCFPYVISKPIHQSQKVVDTENCIVEIEVIPNRKLFQQIFSFISDTEVLSPTSLKKKFKKNRR
jgi:predicted DNA-binding transcriptional regulator YafY